MRALLFPVALVAACAVGEARANGVCVPPQVPDALAAHVALPDDGSFADARDRNEVVEQLVARPGGVWVIGVETVAVGNACNGPDGLEIVSDSLGGLVVRAPDTAVEGDRFSLCESFTDEWAFTFAGQCSCFGLSVSGTTAPVADPPAFDLVTASSVDVDDVGCNGGGTWHLGVADLVAPDQPNDHVLQAWLAESGDDIDVQQQNPVVPALAIDDVSGVFLTEAGKRSIGARLIRLSDGQTSALTTTELTTTRAGCAVVPFGETAAFFVFLLAFRRAR